jgi:hypothetical protein
LERGIAGKNHKRRPIMEYIGRILKDVKIKSYVGIKSREQSSLVSCNKPILEVMTSDADVKQVLNHVDLHKHLLT